MDELKRLRALVFVQQRLLQQLGPLLEYQEQATPVKLTKDGLYVECFNLLLGKDSIPSKIQTHQGWLSLLLSDGAAFADACVPITEYSLSVTASISYPDAAQCDTAVLHAQFANGIAIDWDSLELTVRHDQFKRRLEFALRCRRRDDGSTFRPFNHPHFRFRCADVHKASVFEALRAFVQ
jgi:hypothetical protein